MKNIENPRKSAGCEFAGWWVQFTDENGPQPLPVKSLAERAFRAAWFTQYYRWQNKPDYSIVDSREFTEDCQRLHNYFEPGCWDRWWTTEVKKNHITPPVPQMKNLARDSYQHAARYANDRFRIQSLELFCV